MSTRLSASPNSIGIIGAGVASLQLGLFLLQHHIPVTIYSDHSPAQLRQGRLPNTVALMGAARERTRALGIQDWETPAFDTVAMHIHVGGEQPLTFTGHPAAPLLFIDMRLYLPRLLAAFTEQGGQVVFQDIGTGEVADLAIRHALVVVATGRNGLTQFFPRVATASPYAQPQRLLMGGLFQGIQPLTPQGMCFQIAPGQGEIFESRFLSLEGKLGGLLIEAIPGSELAVMATLSYDEAPERFIRTLLTLLERHAPLTFARIDPATFALNRPLDLLQGAVTPTVRHAYAEVAKQRFILALGDTHVTHDPLTGQGANAAARSAWLLGQLIVDAFSHDEPLDEIFCYQAEQQLWNDLQPVTNWSNAMLQPPPPHVVKLLAAASQHQPVADAFADFFNTPHHTWEIFSSPTRMNTFLQQLGWAAPSLPLRPV